jgi:hypothetical protein
VWPAFAARRASPRPLILSVYGSAAVTAVFVALLGWLLAETRDGSVLGLAERLTSSIQTCWPFIIAIALRRTRRLRPGPAIGGSGGVKDGPPHGPAPAAAGRTGDGSPPGGTAGRRPAVTVMAPPRRAGLAWPCSPHSWTGPRYGLLTETEALAVGEFRAGFDVLEAGDA